MPGEGTRDFPAALPLSLLLHLPQEMMGGIFRVWLWAADQNPSNCYQKVWIWQTGEEFHKEWTSRVFSVEGEPRFTQRNISHPGTFSSLGPVWAEQPKETARGVKIIYQMRKSSFSLWSEAGLSSKNHKSSFHGVVWGGKNFKDPLVPIPAMGREVSTVIWN